VAIHDPRWPEPLVLASPLALAARGRRIGRSLRSSWRIRRAHCGSSLELGIFRV
jgi:hypothetical protein